MTVADEDLVVTIQDCRAAGLCVSGVRKWFASTDLDFRVFLKEGMKASVLLQANATLPLRAIVEARKRING